MLGQLFVHKSPVAAAADDDDVCCRVTPMHNSHAQLMYKVDALKMEGFMNSFINHLGLEHGYTMLVMNPRWSPSLPSYTYRIGFSESELTLLNQMV
jgi:hypothetical protein